MKRAPTARIHSAEAHRHELGRPPDKEHGRPRQGAREIVEALASTTDKDNGIGRGKPDDVAAADAWGARRYAPRQRVDLDAGTTDIERHLMMAARRSEAVASSLASRMLADGWTEDDVALLRLVEAVVLDVNVALAVSR